MKNTMNELQNLEHRLNELLGDANDIQNKERTREMSMVITSIENAQDKIWRLLKLKSNE
jgi:hypothetical protein